jgi:hypothetical protein
MAMENMKSWTGHNLTKLMLGGIQIHPLNFPAVLFSLLIFVLLEMSTTLRFVTSFTNALVLLFYRRVFHPRDAEA